MPNIIVCYKWVLDERDIKINPASLALDASRAKRQIGEYDKNAIEITAKLVETLGGSSTALSYGTADVKQSVKEVLARGTEKSLWVNDPNGDKADAYVTANALAAAVKKAGDYDMIICADSSADISNQQIPGRLAVLLGIPAISDVIKLEVEGTKATVTRRVEDSTETVTVSGPVVLSVLPEICQPRIPSLKQVMAAKKKPQTELKVTDLGLPAEKLTPKMALKSTKGFVMERKNVIISEGSAQEKVAQLVTNLTKENLI